MPASAALFVSKTVRPVSVNSVPDRRRRYRPEGARAAAHLLCPRFAGEIRKLGPQVPVGSHFELCGTMFDRAEAQ
jgi:hypothetical protein